MKLSYFSTATGSAVDRDAGMLRGVSVITEGEAKGHALQIDSKTLEQVKACAETYADGLRVKMDHHTGIDAMVGVLKNFSIDGAQLRADMHLLKSHADFAKIMEMAETMPGAFGLSIAFSGAPEGGEDTTRFARCTEIYSCDIVDIPAANPTGLFSELMKTEPESTIEDEALALATVTITVSTPEDAAEEAAEEAEETAEETAEPTEEASEEVPEGTEEMTEEKEETKSPALDAIVADVATFAAAQTVLTAELATLRADLSTKESVISSLSHALADKTTELAIARADLAAYDSKHLTLSSLHASLKKSLGLMPATNIPDAAVIDQAKTPEDFRREYSAISDPTERAEFYKANGASMF